MNLKRNWWKLLAVFLLLYTIIGGLLMDVPRLPILNESIRNLYFHVPMWFGMIIMLGASVFFSIQYLSSNNFLVLRNSLDDDQMRARISSIYNIFAFPILITLLFILPRMTDSLHPGAGGNPGFNAYDLDNTMRMVFYPAVIGWTLLGVWFTSLRIRIKNLEATTEDII